MGERWAFARLDTRLTLVREGLPVVDEAVLLDPQHGSIATRMGRFDAVGTLLVSGDSLDGFASAIVDRLSRSRLTQLAPLVVSASPLRGGGVIVKMASVKLDALVAEARSLLSFLPSLIGEDPFRGKW
jgi:urease accessory protein UreH